MLAWAEAVLAWHPTGDATTRRELLANLFQSLIVREGVVAEYMPRQDREAEVISLMTAVGRLDLAKSGKGGV